MRTEELLNQVEMILRTKHPNGIVGLISEVYLLPTAGPWVCRPYTARNATATRANIIAVNSMIAVLSASHMLTGVVQVSSAWIIGGNIIDVAHKPGRKEVLVISGRGPAGPRVRVYGFTKKGKYKLPSKLVGTFDMMNPHEEGGE